MSNIRKAKEAEKPLYVLVGKLKKECAAKWKCANADGAMKYHYTEREHSRMEAQWAKILDSGDWRWAKKVSPMGKKLGFYRWSNAQNAMVEQD